MNKRTVGNQSYIIMTTYLIRLLVKPRGGERGQEFTSYSNERIKTTHVRTSMKEAKSGKRKRNTRVKYLTRWMWRIKKGLPGNRNES